jgi:hypothetical protein
MLMIITDRSDLDISLKDSTATVFILLGTADSRAGAVHSLMESKDWDDWELYYLIPDAHALLSPAELRSWFDGKTSGCYAVLGGSSIPKRVAAKGPVSDLLGADEKPDYLVIIRKMLLGEKL